MIHFCAIFALLAYLSSAILYLAIISLKKDWLSLWAGSALKLGFLLHSISIGALFWEEKTLSLVTHADYYYWIAWLLPCFFLLSGRKLDFSIVGAFVASATVLFMASSSYLIHKQEPSGQQSDLWLLSLHAFPALIAELSLVFAFIISCIFLIQSRRLKRRKSLESQAIKGPSLEALEGLNHRFVLVGFIAMTLAVISGSLWGLSQNRRLLGGDPSQWLAMTCWLVLALILHSRLSLRWSAQKLSRVTALVTAVFLLSFFLLVFLNGSLLHGGDYS